MQAKKEIASRKLVRFYIGLAAATGLGAAAMALSPNTALCNPPGGAAVAYLCSPEGATYVAQLMAYALALSLGCLALAAMMRSREGRGTKGFSIEATEMADESTENYYRGE
jgi:hypothetical protein